MNEKDAVIEFNGSQINMFSDDSSDYVNITDMANALKNRRAITSWLKNKQTLEFLDVWEKKHNTAYRAHHLGVALEAAKKGSLSLKIWLDLTNGKGIFTRTGTKQGTYAHKDIAVRFAGWLSPEFELHLVEEIQRLKKIEQQVFSLKILTYDQILDIVRLKEIFKYVAHQEIVEDAHKEVYASKTDSKQAFADFNRWRNQMLGLDPAIIDKRIEQYCKDNEIALTKKILNKTKREKVLLIDSYDAVKNAVWDFLKIKGEINAMNLAELAANMMRIEKGEVIRKNENDLFHAKQDLGVYTNFEQTVAALPEVQAARNKLEARKQVLLGKQPEIK